MTPSPWDQGRADALKGWKQRGIDLYTHPLARAAYNKGWAQGVDDSLDDPQGVWHYTGSNPND